MNVDEILAALNPDIISKFKQAIELGKWADGRPLTDDQKAICLQAIIAYEAKHLPEEQRTGYVPPKNTVCSDDMEILDEEKPLNWKNK